MSVINYYLEEDESGISESARTMPKEAIFNNSATIDESGQKRDFATKLIAVKNFKFLINDELTSATRSSPPLF